MYISVMLVANSRKRCQHDKIGLILGIEVSPDPVQTLTRPILGKDTLSVCPDPYQSVQIRYVGPGTLIDVFQNRHLLYY